MQDSRQNSLATGDRQTARDVREAWCGWLLWRQSASGSADRVRALGRADYRGALASEELLARVGAK